MTSVVVTQTTINASVVQESVSVSVTSSPINVTISPVDINSHSAVTIGTANGLSLSGQVLSLGLSSALATGALSSADWTTFNNKQNALGYTPVNIASVEWIDLTDGGATILHSHAGSGAVWGAITGTLSNQTDLQAALDAKVPNTRTISTTSPLSGGGDLSANRTIAIALADTSTNGYLSSTDWNTFNNKQAALGYTPVDIASANYVDLTDGGATTLHSHAGGSGDISGTGVVGQVAEFVTDTKTIQAAKLIGPASNILTITNAAASTLALNITSAKTLTLTAADNYNLTVPATGTAALLATANVFTTNQMIDLSSDVAGLTIQGTASQTANLITFENSSGTDLSQINAFGEYYFNNLSRDVTLTPAIAITKGETAAGTSAAISVSVDSAGSSSLALYGLAFSGFARPGSGNTNNEMYPVFATATANGLGTTTRLYLYNSRLSLTSGAGTVTNIRLFSSDSYSMAGGTVTTLSGIYIPALNKTGGTLTNQYGLYLEDVDDAATINQAIRTHAGQVSLLGSLPVTSAAGATWNGIELRAATATISGSANITTATGFNYFDVARPTLSAASALTVTNAATLYIANAPLGGGAGPATITNPYSIWVDAGLSRFDGGIDLSVANIQTDTSTGTKIGTATSQKLGFWNVTPVIQPASANQAALTNSTTGAYDGTLIDVGIVFSQAAINDNFTDIYTLLTEIRTALVNAGIMKGAA